MLRPTLTMNICDTEYLPPDMFNFQTLMLKSSTATSYLSLSICPVTVRTFTYMEVDRFKHIDGQWLNILVKSSKIKNSSSIC